MNFSTLDQVRMSDAIVHSILQHGGTLADCVVALANQKQQLVAKMMMLELVAPKKVRGPDGVMLIYRCPDHLVPEAGSELGTALSWMPMDAAPRDGTDILVLFDSASVDVVRLCWWDDGAPRESDKVPAPRPDDVGWWSYRHSVTQEQIDVGEPVGWFPMPTKPKRHIAAS